MIYSKSDIINAMPTDPTGAFYEDVRRRYKSGSMWNNFADQELKAIRRRRKARTMEEAQAMLSRGMRGYKV